jgi:hypothetical protein
MAHWERLSALDALFLEIEDANCHMHVAATLLFDGAPLIGPRGGIDTDRIRAWFASRLHMIPRYRHRLAWIPVEQHPVWVDDDRFNIFYVPLAVGEPDLATRYRRVVEATQAQKGSHVVAGGELLGEIADWTVTGVLTRVVQLAAERRAWNVVVTNVPGPQLPLYLLEAPLRAAYPTVPLFRQQGVGIALFSYDGGLYWGFNADWDALPDLHDLVDALAGEFAALCGLAGIDAALRTDAPVRVA